MRLDSLSPLKDAEVPIREYSHIQSNKFMQKEFEKKQGGPCFLEGMSSQSTNFCLMQKRPLVQRDESKNEARVETESRRVEEHKIRLQPGREID